MISSRHKVVLLASLCVLACPRKGPIQLAGQKDDQVTTTITVSCPGADPQSASSLVSLVQCGVGPGVPIILAFQWVDTDVRCRIDLTGRQASTELSAFSCTPGWSLTHGVLVPEAYPLVDADEFRFDGSMRSGDKSCAVHIEGPLFAQAVEASRFCPCVPDAGVDGGGCAESSGDGGP